jgi:DNA-binding NarL/FixJ family response regulator
VLERMAEPEASKEPRLSPRQLEVLRLLVLGRRTKEIAAALDLSPRTVETHKYQVMDTLGVNSTAELVRYAIEHKLLEG